MKITALAVALVVQLQALPGRAVELIRIGFLPAMSGAYQGESAPEIKAARLAIAELNAAGGIGGRTVELVMADNKSTAPGASEAFTRLAVKEKVSAIIAPSKSVQILALKPAAKLARVPVIIGGTSPRLVDGDDNWFFRMRPDDNTAIAAVTRYLKEDTAFRKIGLLFDSNSAGASQANLFEKFAREAGGFHIASRQSYNSGDTDFSKQFAALKAAGVDLMLAFNANGFDAGQVQKSYAEAKLPFKFLGSPSNLRGTALEVSGSAANGLLVVAEYVPGNPQLQKFAEQYRREYHEELDPYSLWVHDGVMVLAEGLRAGGGDPIKVRSAIHGIRDFAGTLGTVSFDAKGNGLHSASVVRIDGGKPVLLKTIEIKP